MSQRVVMDNTTYQTCTKCLVKYPVEKYNPHRKTCDGCRIRSRREAKKKCEAKPRSEIRRMPKCQCGSYLIKMSVQTHRNCKKIFVYTGFSYCIACRAAYDREGKVL